MNQGDDFPGERRRIAVTGGAGFIGSHTVVALYESGYMPVIIDDLRNSSDEVVSKIEGLIGASIEFYSVDCGDISSLSQLFAAPLHGAIHFAADKSVGESVNQPEQYFANNLGSMARWIAALRHHGVQHLVFSSSCTVYGEPTLLPVNEKAPRQEAISPYGYTKQAGEQLLRYVHAASSANAASKSQQVMGIALLRYFNPIGAHPSAAIGELPIGTPANLVPFLTQAAAGLRDELVVFGNNYPTADGTCVRDYLHVCDLAEAHVAALAHLERTPGDFDVFNLGSGSGHSVLDVIRTFEAATGVAVPHRIGPRRAGDVVSVYAAADKAADILGWRTKRSLHVALADAWRWQQQL
jgi:UDP-glucose 4-epimerase